MARLIKQGEWPELARKANFKAKELAQICGLSVRQLQRDFRRGFGQSPQDWLNEQRIAAAQQLLLAGLPIKTVASELGFKQTSHFCRHFKDLNDMTPSEFIQFQMTSGANVADR